MSPSCPFCQKKILTQKFICSNCLSNFTNQAPRQKLGVYSLYKYEKALRQTIVAAKIKNERRSLNSLLILMEENKLSQKLASEVDLIMPAPSSLWSRARGRFDLAWFLSNSLSKKYHKPIGSPPLKLAWRLKKQAQKKRLQSSFNSSSFTKQKSNKSSLLLIDDVVTTGFTLNRVCLELEAMYNIKLLTLAYSR